MTNEELVRRYAESQVDRDFETMAALRHPDWSVVWPQSGELVRGSANERAIIEHYPGGSPRLAPGGHLVGDQDKWAISPLGGAYLIAGEGETWWADRRATYPDGSIWHAVSLIELRDGRIWRETQYWAPSFDAPAWRAQWVERLSDEG